MLWRSKHSWTRLVLLLATVLAMAFPALSAYAVAGPDESLLDISRVMSTIEDLCSPEYDGRLAGTDGNRLAMRYIAERFAEMGLKNPAGLTDYLQPYWQKTVIPLAVPVLGVVDDGNKVVMQFKYLADFGVRTAWDGIRLSGETTAPMVCVEEVDQFKDDQRFDGRVMLVGKPIVQSYGDPAGVVKTITARWQARPQGIILNVQPNAAGRFTTSRALTGSRYMEPGPSVVYCSDETFNRLKRAAGENLRAHISLHFAVRTVEAANVIGIIPGTETASGQDHIVIGAHFDHIGSNLDGSYNPGALDNASGVATVMEIARVVLSGRSRPRKTVVIAAFNGEEIGLSGSAYYAAHPLYPLAGRTMINIDMVGSREPVPLTMDGGNADAQSAMTGLAKALGIELACIAAPSMMSDHRPIAARGANAFLIIHNDGSRIHSAVDTLEHISPQRLEETIRLLLRFVGQSAY